MHLMLVPSHACVVLLSLSNAGDPAVTDEAIIKESSSPG